MLCPFHMILTRKFKSALFVTLYQIAVWLENMYINRPQKMIFTYSLQKGLFNEGNLSFLVMVFRSGCGCEWRGWKIIDEIILDFSIFSPEKTDPTLPDHDFELRVKPNPTQKSSPKSAGTQVRKKDTISTISQKWPK